MAGLLSRLRAPAMRRMPTARAMTMLSTTVRTTCSKAALARQSTRAASMAAAMRARCLSTSRDMHHPAAEEVEAKPQWMDKILVANRGEIACRVIKTARRLGVKTVAVYSDADANAMHVKMADEAYHIGPARSTQSYLKYEKIIEVAKASGAKGIHPGYGFLSENANFADECEKNGIVFIGPPSSAIVSMGSKSESKEIMEKHDVPLVKGYHGDDQSRDGLLAQAKEIGFPVMLKAVMGGGGKGMRVVQTEEDFDDMLSMCMGEARESFSDTRMLVEKYVQRPRHVEVQVFADTYGNAVYLFERDCSLQRRHQKVIEEAPAPGLTPELRRELGEAAVRAALAVNYVGAGTVEFILDTATNQFYFMEMNTRLQVEHPVTEMVTGKDLVEWQLMIASGYPLPVSQDELEINGHSFEARIYAEDPADDFLPTGGPLKFLSPPEESSVVRVETGVEQGDEVSSFYDPMIAKLVVWGPDRQRALAKLLSELKNYNIAGVTTNIKFLQACAAHPEFAAGNVTTDFIPDFHDELLPAATTTNTSDTTLAIVTCNVLANAVKTAAAASEAPKDDPTSPWNATDFFRPNYDAQETLTLAVGGEKQAINVKHLHNGTMQLTMPSGASFRCKLHDDCIEVDGVRHKPTVAIVDRTVHVFDETTHHQVDIVPPAHELLASAADEDVLVCPMPGTIISIDTEIGQSVKKNDVLVVMEGMKLQKIIRAPRDGVVKAIKVGAGASVNKSQVLIEMEPVEQE
eukprot:m.29832 g.29832  ORF g.29832 m.29832 type:complete len:746 (-) comp9213_c0_seq1:398-2635(-)